MWMAPAFRGRDENAASVAFFFAGCKGRSRFPNALSMCFAQDEVFVQVFAASIGTETSKAFGFSARGSK